MQPTLFWKTNHSLKSVFKKNKLKELTLEWTFEKIQADSSFHCPFCSLTICRTLTKWFIYDWLYACCIATKFPTTKFFTTKFLTTKFPTAKFLVIELSFLEERFLYYFVCLVSQFTSCWQFRHSNQIWGKVSDDSSFWNRFELQFHIFRAVCLHCSIVASIQFVGAHSLFFCSFSCFW